MARFTICCALMCRNQSSATTSALQVDGELSLQGAAGSGPRLLPAGVLNGASLLPSPVAPGEILTLGGAGVGPATPELPADSASAPVLGGTSVLFDGVRSPILYAAPGQVNLVVPYEVHGKQGSSWHRRENRGRRPSQAASAGLRADRRPERRRALRGGCARTRGRRPSG
ncbi:MAG: hypothetical protein LAQ30_10880, partial [Acidobacteriia bacterium]|nr:hypothetical protein [Terriglobia bacterium]